MPHQDYVNDRKPLVSFASKPRPTAKQDGVKKPAFLVVRKKASLLQKKKMCEVKSFSSTQPQPISSSEKSKHGTESKKLLPNDAEKSGAETNVMPKKKVTRKAASKRKSDWAVSDQSKPSYNNTGIISSLFFKNPEIPSVTKDHVEATEENVFSSQSFSALKIHRFLVSNNKLIKSTLEKIEV